MVLKLKIKETGETCPECKTGKLLDAMENKRLLRLLNYPKCKYIKKDANIAQNGTGVNVIL
jgi:ssDNA-binding Zn-finger/Zn-ribbon topoisomerase 1